MESFLSIFINIVCLSQRQEWSGGVMISSLMGELFRCLHPPPPKQLTDIWYSQAGCQVIWKGSLTTATTSTTIAMIIRLVLVWTVFSSVAAFDVFGANHQVLIEIRQAWSFLSTLRHWLLPGTTARQLVRAEQNTASGGCEFLWWKLCLVLVYLSTRNIWRMATR